MQKEMTLNEFMTPTTAWEIKSGKWLIERTVRGLKMFEKKLTAQMMIEVIQFDKPKMFDGSRTLFFKYFLIRCYLSVKNFLFSFCAGQLNH